MIPHSEWIVEYNKLKRDYKCRAKHSTGIDFTYLNNKRKPITEEQYDALLEYNLRDKLATFIGHHNLDKKVMEDYLKSLTDLINHKEFEYYSSKNKIRVINEQKEVYNYLNK